MLTWDLASNGAPYFSFSVLEQLDEGWDKITADDFFINGLGDL